MVVSVRKNFMHTQKIFLFTAVQYHHQRTTSWYQQPKVLEHRTHTIRNFIVYCLPISEHQFLIFVGPFNKVTK